MSDQDLRALAAKLLKHYAADNELGAVVDDIVANTELDRGEDIDAPQVSSEERNLLNLLGGYMAKANELKPLALTAQGCGDDGGDDDDDDDDDDEAEAAPSAPETAAPEEAPAAPEEEPEPPAAPEDLPSAKANAVESKEAPNAQMQAVMDQLAAKSEQTYTAPDLRGSISFQTGPSPEMQAALNAQNAADNTQSTDAQSESTASNDGNQGTNGNDNGAGGLGGAGGGTSISDTLANIFSALNPIGSAQAADIKLGPPSGNAIDARSLMGPQQQAQTSVDPAKEEAAGRQAALESLRSSLQGSALSSAMQSPATAAPSWSSPTSLALTTAPSWTSPAVAAAQQTAPQAPQAPQTPAAPTRVSGLSPEFWAQLASPVLNDLKFSTPTAPNAPSIAPSAPSIAQNAPATAPSTVAAAPSLPTSVAPISSSTAYNLGPSFWSDPKGWAAAKAENAASNVPSYAVNAMMMGVPVAGTLNALSGLLGGPTVGGVMQGGTPAGPADMTGYMGGDGATKPLENAYTSAPLSSGGGGATAPSKAPATIAVSSLPPEIRAYLGLPVDPYSYGYKGEHRYYADGGLVSEPTPPVQPLMESSPTMAYTDGQGAIGSVAQPPGLSPYDSYGSDAPHASPMAPSAAAAAPTLSPFDMDLGTYNQNSLPVPAPISQNPNVAYALGSPQPSSANSASVAAPMSQNSNFGYALGMPPLSQLKG